MTASILIIEDNQTNMELMVYLLGAFGYILKTASNGPQGLQIALRDQPDLVICDLEIPGMNGYEVVRNLRNQAGAARIPIIAVTAYAMVGDRDKVLAAGFDGYLSKPIYPETFVKQVEAFLPFEKRSSEIRQSHDVTLTSAPVQQSNRAAILVVDDSPVNLSLICGTLEPSGYSVTAVNTVEAAIDQTCRNSFDLILSDLHMSPESGLGFLQLIKADPKLRSLPFILFTASSPDPADAVRERSLALGADKFLFRPIEPSRLLLEIEECLVKSRNVKCQKV